MKQHLLPPRYKATRACWFAIAELFIGCASAQPPNQVPTTPAVTARRAIVLRSYVNGTTGVRANNTQVKLWIGPDSALPDEPVLFVDYPAPSDDPAGRDVWCDAEITDWSSGTGISFQIKSTKAENLSVSFFDRNHVVYTTWVDLKAGRWQPVRISFSEMRPNPNFQPPDAKTGAPLDLREIKGVAFAPHHQEPGGFVVSRFLLTR